MHTGVMFTNPITGEQCNQSEFCEACRHLMDSIGESCEICKCTDCPAHT